MNAVHLRVPGTIRHSQQQALDDWRRQVLDVLHGTDRALPTAIAGNGPLAAALTEVSAWMDVAPATWAQQWNDLAPAREVADLLQGQCVLLVFGRFNAGKSSLCNYLARRAEADGKQPRWFQIVDGRLQRSTTPFAEGATETTTTLQGVELGSGLILLDTPGLHSTSAENARLTRLFTDCADGVLWLTSSSAPGQVQELDEVAREIHRRKPLLPVITRSDLYEEDEIDGALVSVLCNKSAMDRALQEADVSARGAAKLQALNGAADVFCRPLSISVAAAVNAGDSLAARENAGISRLQDALAVLVDAARAYNGRKQEEVLLHHLQEHVLATMATQWRPRLDTVGVAVKGLLDTLPSRLAQARDTAWRSVVLALPGVIDSHLNQQQCDVTLRRLADHAAAAVAAALQRHLPAFALQIEHRALVVAPPALDSVADTAAAYQRLHATLEHYVQTIIDHLLADAKERAQEGLRALMDRVGGWQRDDARLQAQLHELAQALRG